MSEKERPIILAPGAGLRVTVQAKLQDYRWEAISIGGLFPRLSLDVVREIPVLLWDSLWKLHEETPRMLGTRDAALEICRGVYGIDPLYLKVRETWDGVLARIVLANEGLTPVIAQALSSLAKDSGRADIGITELTDAIAAKELLTSTGNIGADCLLLPIVEKIIIDQTRRANELRTEPVVVENAAFTELPSGSESAEWWLAYGWRIANAVSKSGIGTDCRNGANAAFAEWVVRGQYNLALSSANPKVLRMDCLLSRLHEESSGRKLMVIMIDCLGLVSWLAIEEEWRKKALFSRTERRAAFAVIPTLTSFSRRAFFEGTLPSRFSVAGHTGKMERGLWRKRFGLEGDYFDVSEAGGIDEAMQKGRQRICIMDTSWDQLIHSLQAEFDSAWEAAKRWGERTPTSKVVQAGLANGYRVLIVSDHGHISCVGTGRLQAGELPERASRRVGLFQNGSLAKGHERLGTTAYQPAGMPINCFPLFTEQNTSFDIVGARSESHGGMSLEETIIPVVEVLP